MSEKHGRSFLRLLLACAFTLVCALSTQGQTFKVLHDFAGGADGVSPLASLVLDKLGNLYGTTLYGGPNLLGAVFELSPNSDGTWTETIIHSFRQFDPDGEEPSSNLILDAGGNLYGTTMGGGIGRGTAFELTPGPAGWSLTLLYTFGSYKGDAGPPRGGLIMDAQGNLYGTAGGGTGVGAVYELSQGSGGWTESLPYNFGVNHRGLKGDIPFGNLLLDVAGDLYGITLSGGDLSCGISGCGGIYRLTPTPGGWKENVLHNFAGPPVDGDSPAAQLAFDSKGRLYGATDGGGGTLCHLPEGCGTIFRLIHSNAGWKETLIYTFEGGANGFAPGSGLTFDQAGNAYGVTAYGGTECSCGVVYKLIPGSNGKWTYSVLHAFTGADGAFPESGVILDGKGNLYGTTEGGGSSGVGVVYQITP